MKMRNALAWWGLFCFVGSSGCLWGDCPDNVHGVKDGQRFETTIIAPFAGDRSSRDASCGSLGDLDAGVVVTWTAANGGSAETCDFDVGLNISNVTSGELVKTFYLGYDLKLPGGCSGDWRLSLKALRDDADFSRALPDPAKPSWILERTFTPKGDLTSCPTALAAAPWCSDAFVASTAAL